MAGDKAHKNLALFMIVGLLLLLSFFIVRHSPYADGLLDYFKSPQSDAETASSKSPFALPELIKKVKPSVVEITTYTSLGEMLGVGSGFFIGPGQVVSNWHVVSECYRAEVKTADHGIYAVNGILASDKDADLVLLDIDIAPNDIAILGLAANLPDEGERIVIVGNPLGLEGTVSDGIVSSIRDVPGLGRLLQVTAPISQGSSGGPVVNMFGEVVGVARGMLKEGQNLNFAVPGEQVASLKRGQLITFVGLRRQHAVSLYERALQLTENGSFGLAIPLLEQAVEEHRDYEQAWLQLGNCEFQTAQYRNALESFKQVIRINPASEEGLYQAGRTSAELEYWDDAITYYRRVIQLNSKNADAQFGLGLALGWVGDDEGAQRSYQILLRLSPTRAQELHQAFPETVGETP